MDVGKGRLLLQQHCTLSLWAGYHCKRPSNSPSRHCQRSLVRGNPQALKAHKYHTGTMDTRDEHMQYISQSIREIPDWPKKGILFQDITSMLLDAKVIPREMAIQHAPKFPSLACRACTLNISHSGRSYTQIGPDLTHPTCYSRHFSTPLMTSWTVTKAKTSMQLQVGRAVRIMLCTYLLIGDRTVPDSKVQPFMSRSVLLYVCPGVLLQDLRPEALSSQLHWRLA